MELDLESYWEKRYLHKSLILYWHYTTSYFVVNPVFIDKDRLC